MIRRIVSCDTFLGGAVAVRDGRDGRTSGGVWLGCGGGGWTGDRLVIRFSAVGTAILIVVGSPSAYCI